MKQTLSPKQLAEAVGASESSVKRWIDSGKLHADRTVGGHRRVTTPEAIRFIRDQGMTLLKPAVLGMHELDPQENELPGLTGSANEDLYHVLRDGRARDARALLIDLYVNQGHDLAGIFDGPMRYAMAEVGKLWAHDRQGILLEHRATDAAIQAVNRLRGLLSEELSLAGQTRPIALGGAPEGDLYLLPSMMCACLCAQAGLQEMNLGPQTPLETLELAVNTYRPVLVWMTCSVPDAWPGDASVSALGRKIQENGGRMIVGGRGVPVSERPIPHVSVHRDMTGLQQEINRIKHLWPADAADSELPSASAS